MWIESFLRYIQYERAYSSHTVLSYKNDLFSFRQYVECEGMPFVVTEIDTPTVRSFIVKLLEEGASPRTAARKTSALRAFFNYLIKEGVVTKNPAIGVRLPKVRKKLPTFVQPREMDVLLDTAPFGDEPFRASRDQLVIALLYATGIRRSELIGLRDNDLDLEGRSLKVHGKRNKERIVPFGAELAQQIESYLSQRAHLINGEQPEALLIKADGKPLYAGLVYRIVKQSLSQVTTLEKRSPHVLRHTFASAMLNNGAQLNSVRELLGHSSLASTEVYTHITFEELKQSYKQAHPRATIKKEDTMEISIQALHFDASEQLVSFIQKKLAKVAHHYESIISAEVSLKVIKPEAANNKEVGIKLQAPKIDELFSSKIADTFEEAVDLAVDALMRQLEKNKEKTR